MKLFTKTTIITILLSVTLFIVGFYLWNPFFMATLPIVGDVKYTTNLTEPSKQILVFALTLALIPILTILIWKFAPIFATQKKVLSIVIILVAMTLFVATRREMIKYQAKHLQSTTIPDYAEPTNSQLRRIESRIPLSTLNFELFALAGLVTGSVTSFFSLRHRIN